MSESTPEGCTADTESSYDAANKAVSSTGTKSVSSYLPAGDPSELSGDEGGGVYVNYEQSL